MMRMKNFGGLAVFSFLAVTFSSMLAFGMSQKKPVVAGAPANTFLQDQITERLRRIHGVDNPRETWRALGPEAPAVMIAMFKKSDVHMDRLRLLEAIGFFEDPVAHRFIKDELKSNSSSLERSACLRGLSNAGDADSIKIIQEFTNDSDLNVRKEASRLIKLQEEAATEAQSAGGKSSAAGPHKIRFKPTRN